MMKTNPLGTVVDLHLQVVEPCDSSAVWQVCLIMPKKDGISCVAEKKTSSNRIWNLPAHKCPIWPCTEADISETHSAPSTTNYQPAGIEN